MNDKKMLIINAEDVTGDMKLPALIKNPDGTCVAVTPDGDRHDCKDFDQDKRLLFADSWQREFDENCTIRNGVLAGLTFQKVDNMDNDWLTAHFAAKIV